MRCTTEAREKKEKRLGLFCQGEEQEERKLPFLRSVDIKHTGTRLYSTHRVTQKFKRYCQYETNLIYQSRCFITFPHTWLVFDNLLDQTHF